MVNIILGSTKFELQCQSDKDKRRIITLLGAVLYLKLEEAVSSLPGALTTSLSTMLRYWRAIMIADMANTGL
jgi:hypothetical protein